jgi:vacuolar protein sorting-associated protein 13A/C
MLEGGKALAKGVLAGAVGVLARPLEGAERGGIAGFIGGVAKVMGKPQQLLQL